MSKSSSAKHRYGIGNLLGINNSKYLLTSSLQHPKLQHSKLQHSKSKPIMSDAGVPVASLTPGDIVFAVPPKINDSGIPITKTTGGKVGKHPVVVFSVDEVAKTITGVLQTTFNNASALDESPLDSSLYKWFLPVKPAEKESIHDPVDWPGGSGKPAWINLKDVLTIEESKIVSNPRNDAPPSDNFIEKEARWKG